MSSSEAAAAGMASPKIGGETPMKTKFKSEKTGLIPCLFPTHDEVSSWFFSHFNPSFDKSLRALFYMDNY
jgi:hypothetical protein